MPSSIKSKRIARSLEVEITEELQDVLYEELEKIDNGAEGEVYFTDPDNPDAEIAGITAAFEARRNGNGWLDNYGTATRLAHRTSALGHSPTEDSGGFPKGEAGGPGEGQEGPAHGNCPTS